MFEGSEKTKREPQGERVSVMLPNIYHATAFKVCMDVHNAVSYPTDPPR